MMMMMMMMMSWVGHYISVSFFQVLAQDIK